MFHQVKVEVIVAEKHSQRNSTFDRPYSYDSFIQVGLQILLNVCVYALFIGW